MKKWFFSLALVTTIGYFGLLINYQNPSVVAFDEKLSNALYGNAFIEFFHWFGETKFIALVTILLTLYLWLRQRHYRGMFFVLMTVAGGNVLNQVMKRWIERPRPDIPNQLASFSFPSGHAMVGLLYTFTIAYLATENTSSKRFKVVTWIIACIAAALIGLSRVAGSRHYASDVLAGWFLGYTWFILAVIWYERRKRNFSQTKQ